MTQPSNRLDDYPTVGLLFPSNYIKADDLQGRDVTVTIDRLEPRHELKMEGGVTDYKPTVYLKGKTKAWILNKTNARTIAGLYGSEVREWFGKSVVLFPTTCKAKGDTTPCIRVRPYKPEDAPARKGDKS